MFSFKLAKPFPCFPADARVLTINGYRAISSLRPGDRVISYSPTDGVTKPRLVKKVLEYGPKRLCKIDLASSHCSVRTTPSHSFLTQSGWLRASQLKSGDVLICSDADKEIVSVTRLPNTETVYNLITDCEHTFIVDHGVIAHNYSYLRDIRVAADNFIVAARKRFAARKLKLIQQGA